MTGRIKYPNDNYRYVTEITIMVSPAYFNSDKSIEKMVIKCDSVSYMKTIKEKKYHYKKWTYKSNSDMFLALFNAIVRDVDEIFNKEMCYFSTDSQIVKITRKYDDNSKESTKFTGDFEINDLHSLGYFLLELVPKIEDKPNFLLKFKNDIEDSLFWKEYIYEC